MCDGELKSAIPVSRGSIEESIDLDVPYRTVTERYYKPYYQLDSDRSRRNDLCLLVHSNRISLVGLAPSHPILARGVRIDTVNCEVAKHIDRKNNITAGKSKKGGQNLKSNSVLCYLEVGEESYEINAISPGKLICMNKSILEDPNLISRKPDSDGHIAILLPNLGEIEACKNGLYDQESYNSFIKKENL